MLKRKQECVSFTMAEVDRISHTLGNIEARLDSIDSNIEGMRQDRLNDSALIWGKVNQIDDRVKNNESDIAAAKVTIRNLKIFCAAVVAFLTAFSLFNRQFKITTIPQVEIQGPPTAGMQ